MKDKPQPDLKEEKANVQFNCPVAIRDEIKRIAQEEDRTLGEQMTRALREWLLPHEINKELHKAEARSH